ncbi:MAG: nucleoside recognition domain-containing protein [Oscillospiraceae bacterium]
MALTWIWVGMVCISLIFGAVAGQSAAVGAAAAQGVQQAVTFCLTVGGIICLWSGVMEVMRRSGIAAGLSRLLQPVLRRLFPRASRDAQTLDALSMNVSANLLGLGNAATPAGVRAAQAMAREIRGDAASDELCLLVVLNTASIQLLPVTIAAVREAAGAAVPFDILPAVWVTSLCSVTVGLLTGKGTGAHMAVSDVLALTVPALLAGVGLCGVLTGTDVFSALTDGALDGLKTVVRIFPALCWRC